MGSTMAEGGGSFLSGRSCTVCSLSGGGGVAATWLSSIFEAGSSETDDGAGDVTLSSFKESAGIGRMTPMRRAFPTRTGLVAARGGRCEPTRGASNE